MNLLNGLPFVFLLIAIRVYIDYVQIEIKQKYVNHFTREIIQGGTMILIALVTNHFNPLPWEIVTAQVVAYFAIFWILFDIGLNKARNYNWLYNTKSRKDTASRFDKFIMSISQNGATRLNIKLAILVIALGVYYNY